jgi:hypothetical protein
MRRILAIILLGGLLAGLILQRGHRRGDASSVPKVPVAQPVAIAKVSSDGGTLANRPELPAERSLQLQRDIADALRRGGYDGQNRVGNDMLPALVALDAAAAGRLAQTWEPGGLREWLLRQVAERWSAADCAGAITWVATIENSQDQRAAAGALVAQIAQLDPAGALTAAQLFQVGVDDGSQEYIAQIWTETNPTEAVEWIVNRPASTQRDRLLTRIANVRVQSNPVEAATLVSNFLPAGSARDEAITSVSRQWAERDPNAATLWVQQLPAGPLRTNCLAAIASAGRNR